MPKEDRDILEILQEELSFIEKGGYGRSVRTPSVPKSIFQDSLSCLNYGYPSRVHPCNECQLIDFVSLEDRSTTVPCHHIKMDGEGETIDELDVEGNDNRLQDVVRQWLRDEIEKIQAERANTSSSNSRLSSNGNF